MRIQGTYSQKVYARLIGKKVMGINGNSGIVVEMLNARLVRKQSYRRIAKAIGGMI